MSLQLGDSAYGKSVLATKGFSTGDLVIQFAGNIIHRGDLPRIERIEDDRYLQVGSESYLGPSGGLDDFINHSCEPNCGLVFKDHGVFLHALRDIVLGEEINFDYSTTMNEDNWEMDCLCGSPGCRGRVRDFKHLPKSRQEYYLSLGVVPSHVLIGLAT